MIDEATEAERARPRQRGEKKPRSSLADRDREKGKKILRDSEAEQRPHRELES